MRIKSFFRDIALTFLAEGLVLLSFFLIYRLIGAYYGSVGVGKYSLIKRVAALIQSFLLLGMGMSLPRYIAMAKSEVERNQYMKSGFIIAGNMLLFFLLISNVFRSQFSNVFFGSNDYIELVTPFSFFLTGLVLHNLAYFYFQGCNAVKFFNSLQIINMALIPIIVILFFKGALVGELISLMGIIPIFITCLFFLFFGRSFFKDNSKIDFKKTALTLLRYGLPRVAGDFILVSLFSFGIILVAHFATIQDVGYLSISQSFISAIGALIAPIGLILLPRISGLAASGSHEIVRKHLDFFIPALIQCLIFVSVQLFVFSDIIVESWLGGEFLPAVPLIRIMLASLCFYSFYVSVRSILDAVEIKPLNTINLSYALSLFIFLIIGFFMFFKSIPFIINISISLAGGLILLGVLTYHSIKKIYQRSLKNDIDCLLQAIFINIFFGGIAFYIKNIVQMQFYSFIFFEFIFGVIYLLILWLSNVQWIRGARKIIARG